MNKGVVQGENKIELDDGYQMGYGVFETILLKEEKCIFLKEHLERMRQGLKYLGIQQSLVENDIIEYVQKLGLKNCALKIMASQDNLIITNRTINYKQDDYQQGFAVKLSECIQDSRSHTSHIKSFNRINQQIELKRAAIEGYREVLFLNEQGFLTEGCISNVFFVKRDAIFTPALSCGLLPGILRQWIINHFEVHEGNYTINELMDCDEAFLTNSLMGVMRIISFQKTSLLISEKTDEVQKKYWEFLEGDDEGQI